MEKHRHTVLVTTSCVIYHEGKILMIKYGRGEKIGFVNRLGGHIEKGEGILESAKREIKEESGLDVNVKLKGVIHVSNFFGKNYMMYMITAESDTDIVQQNEEGELIRIDPKEIDNYKLFSNTKLILKKLSKMKDGEVFCATNVYNDDGSLKSFEIEK